jgi:type IVB pilus formation R64 PilN family outer membrane protein
MKRVVNVLAAALAVACLLPGCTGLMGRINRDVASDTAQADTVLHGLQDGDARVHDRDNVVVNNGLWLSGTRVNVARADALPPLFDRPAMFDRTVSSLQEFAERITRLTAVPTRVAASAALAAQRAMGGGYDASSAGAHSTGAAGVPPLPPGMMSSARARNVSTSGGRSLPANVHIAFQGGTLKGLLDTASARFGVSWKFTDGNIVFYFTDTRVFQVTSIPGDAKLTADVVSAATNNPVSAGSGAGAMSGASTASSGSGSSSSNNNADTSMTAQLSVFSSLESSIKSMLSSYGSVVPSPATGSIAVTDTPDVLERVSEFMNLENRVLSRQVLVNVTVLSVTLSNSDSYGINWTAVYQALGTRFGITTTLPIPTSTNEFSASVITPSSRASGTSAMINALSTQGSVRRKTSASVTTLNDQPVPVQVATQKSYLAQVSTTNTINVGSQTALTPGTVTTGFNLTLLPHVLDDGTVMMQFYTNLSQLLSLDTISSGGQTIELPNVETRNFLQRVAIKSGQTLVLSGYEGLADDGTQQGVGVPQNALLGGSLSASRSREIIVILITPVLTAGV